VLGQGGERLTTTSWTGGAAGTGTWQSTNVYLQRETRIVGVIAMFFPDGFTDNTGTRIGWLEKGHTFTQGPTDPSFLKKLLELYRERANSTRGYHRCDFCPNPELGLLIVIAGTAVKLGGAEVHVRAGDDRVFAAPDLIHHYVVEHSYAPPQEFVDAVLAKE
jgi:hypothetical protein